MDQVFISKDLLDAMITCNALPDRPGINTDHLLILTTLDFALARAPKGFPKNFHDLDWEEFIKKLETKLNLLDPPTHIHMQEELDKACRELTVAIQDIIASEVPVTELGIKAKRWWTKELTKLRQEANRKRHKASKYKNWPGHQLHEERRLANKTFHKTLECTKWQHWQDWLEKADNSDIWTAHKYTLTPAGDRGKCRIPVLKLKKYRHECITTTNDEKASMLAKSFSPHPPVEDLIHFVYPKPACDFSPIMKEQIRRQLTRLKP